jgi:hypothetical protein
MSNIFLNDDARQILNNVDNLTTTQVNDNNEFSATSSFQMGQFGGSKDVNELVSMLTSSEFNNNQCGGDDVDNLLSMLTSSDNELTVNGKKNNQNGGSNDIDVVRYFFNNLRNKGVDVNLTLNDLTMSEFFDGTSLNTSTDVNSLVGGGSRPMNPTFSAILQVKKHISETLKVPNSPKLSKYASELIKEHKGGADLSNANELKKLVDKIKDYVNNNVNKIREIVNKLLKH